MQPWQVHATGSTMELWLDRARASSLLDVECCASVFSLGSFAENVVIVAQGLGLSVDIQVAESISFQRAMAILRFTGDASLKQAHPLESCIAERTTNRKPHQGPMIEDEFIERLRGCMSDHCSLHAKSAEADRRIASDILGVGEVFRLRHPTLNAQMWGEVRWTPEEVSSSRDGIDVATLEVPDEALPMLQNLRDHDFVMRCVPDAAIAGMAQSALLAASHVCCVGMEATTVPGCWFAAGRDVQRLWLQATACGLALQPWTALTFLIARAELFGGKGLSDEENTAMRTLGRRLRILFDIPESRLALFVFRLSRADEPSARSLRRAASEYTTLHK
jgi:hypothetical protein